MQNHYNAFERLFQLHESTGAEYPSSSKETIRRLDILLREEREREILGNLPLSISTYLESIIDKAIKLESFRIQEELEKIAECIDACIGLYMDQSDFASQDVTSCTRGFVQAASLVNLIADDIITLDGNSTPKSVDCQMKLAAESSSFLTGSAVIVPVVANGDGAERVLIGAAVFLLRKKEVTPNKMRLIEGICLQLVEHAWRLRELLKSPHKLPVFCTAKGWSTERYLKSLCQVFVKDVCPELNSGYFSCSLWFKDAFQPEAYVRATYGYDYHFLSNPLPVARSAIGLVFDTADWLVHSFSPSHPRFLEKEKAQFAGVQVMHVVKASDSSQIEPMALACHCFDVEWRNHSPHAYMFRFFAKELASIAAEGDRRKVDFALMDLDRRFRSSAYSATDTIAIDALSKILRDRMTVYFGATGCTVFVAEKYGQSLYPISTHGLKEDRLRFHEGRLVPERTVLRYDTSRRGLLKLMSEVPNRAFCVNRPPDYSYLQETYPSLVPDKPRTELQEDSIPNISQTRLLGIGLRTCGLSFVIRIARKTSEPPFRESDRALLIEIVEFLNRNPQWKKAIEDVAIQISQSDKSTKVTNSEPCVIKSDELAYEDFSDIDILPRQVLAR